MIDLDAKMPYSLEAEQSVLGAVLIDPECMAEIVQTLSIKDFYYKNNAIFFDTMLRMFNSSIAIDVVTLLDQLAKGGEIEEEPAKTYIYELAQFVPTTANLRRYIEIVREKALLRRLAAAAGEIGEACLEAASDPAEILDLAEQKIYDIATGRAKHGFVPITEAVTEAYDRIVEMASGNKSKYAGIPTHFTRLDDMIGGLKKSDLIILAARPGIGKTSLAINIAENVAVLEKKKVAVFSLEMSSMQLVTRVISSQARIDSKSLMQGRIADDQWAAIAEAGSVISSAPFLIDDTASITISEIKAKARREKNVDLVIIDYLQLMQSGGKFENRVNEVSAITRNLKIMARELDIPVLCLSQLSRAAVQRGGAATEHRPRLSDLRESGSIEQDADIVLFLNPENPTDDPTVIRPVELIVAKNRHGEVGIINLSFDGRYTKFMNAEQYHDEPY